MTTEQASELYQASKFAIEVSDKYAKYKCIMFLHQAKLIAVHVEQGKKTYAECLDETQGFDENFLEQQLSELHDWQQGRILKWGD